MQVVKASDFKARCLALLDDLDSEGLLITKRGRPIARVLPVKRASAELIGILRGKLSIHGDILSTGLAWDAES